MTNDDHFLHIEVQRLCDEAGTLLAALAPVRGACRLRDLDYFDRLHDQPSADIELVRTEVGYDRLLDACLALKVHASAAADDASDVAPRLVRGPHGAPPGPVRDDYGR
jgi:hypothetical protein